MEISLYPVWLSDSSSAPSPSWTQRCFLLLLPTELYDHTNRQEGCQTQADSPTEENSPGHTLSLHLWLLGDLVPFPLPPSQGDLGTLQTDGIQQHPLPGAHFLHRGFRPPLHFVVLHRGPCDTSQHCLQRSEGSVVSVFYTPELRWSILHRFRNDASSSSTL